MAHYGISDDGARRIPRPFEDAPASEAGRVAARDLWDWHAALANLECPPLEEAELDARFEAERARVEAGAPLSLVPTSVSERAYAACRTHGLSTALLAEQVAAARRFCGPVRFESQAAWNAFVRGWAAPHARLLAGLVGAAHTWQLPMVDELATAFFVVGRLAALPEDLARDRLFIPEPELDRAGVTVDRLRAGNVDDSVRRLLWKQAVRARDAFAQGLPLVHDLAGPAARAFKRWWLGGLELLTQIERRGFDVWSGPVRLSALQRFQVRLQALLARRTFKRT